MELSIQWHNPIVLGDGRKENLVYSIEESDWEKIPKTPGIYVFFRLHGKSRTPLYIGQAGNLNQRIYQQLTNNVSLVMGLKNNVRAGTRMVAFAEFHAKKGQQRSKCLGIIEDAYIKAALSMGYNLINVQGTAIKVHEIYSNGTKRNHFPFARHLTVQD
jgi:hypothetical protein